MTWQIFSNEMTGMVGSGLCQLLTLSLLHSLWQGALLAMAACWIKSNKRLTVNCRFCAVFTILVMIALAPVVNFSWLPQPHKTIAQQPLQLPGLPGRQLSLMSVGELGIGVEPGQSAGNETVVIGGPAVSIENEVVSSTIVTFVMENWTTLAAVCYVVGVFTMMFRLVMGLQSQRRVGLFCRRIAGIDNPSTILDAAVQAAASFGRSLTTPIMLFDGLGAAMVVGCLRPVVLINTSLAAGLTPQQLEQILAHELAHIYRYDPLTQLVQRLIESFLFFHPAVWLVSRQVSDLRELCCDEAVTRNHNRFEYADTLLRCATIDNRRARQSSLVLAATGMRGGQLASRIESLLDSCPARARRLSGVTTPIVTVMGAVVIALIFVLALSLYFRLDSTQNSSTSIQLQSQASVAAVANPDWKWQFVDAKQIEPRAFLFGGRELTLSESIPPDVRVEAMVVEEFCRFAQWHFGDSNSTRVAVLIEMEGDSIHRVFVDKNRNRVIEDNESLVERTNRDRTWLTSLDVEVHENARVVHARRQIGITPKRKSDSIRITTLGYAEGEIELLGKQVQVRRVDLDGNGLPNESSDQIWFDLDQDGDFDQLNERQVFRDFVDVAGERYVVRSDRLGQSLNLTPSGEQGLIRFVFELADQTATLEKLEGSLRDESGLLIAIRPSQEPVSVPVGRYCVENLVIQATDAKGATWRMTLNRGFDRGWFEVGINEEHQLKLLDELAFSFAPEHVEDSFTGHKTHLVPSISTANGLIATDFTCVDRDYKKSDAWSNNSVKAHFKIESALVSDQEPTQCTSGFN